MTIGYPTTAVPADIGRPDAGGGTGARRRRAGVRGGPGLGTYAGLVLLLIISAFPLYWSVVVASQDQASISRYPPALVPGPHLWEHIRTAFAQANFG